MSVSFSLSVLPVDANGDLVWETVREPSYGLADGHLRELLDAKESARHFGEVVEGLGLRWYRCTTMEACVAEARNPTAADCFRPGDISADVRTLLARLTELAPRLPRLYRLQKSTRVGEWWSGARVFYGGRLFNVGAGWDVCRAIWWAERSMQEALHARLYGSPDIEHDLRGMSAFRCVEAVRRDGDFVPGDPMTLLVGRQSAREHFEPFLEPILDFCARAEAGGFLVFTYRG